MLSRRAAPRSTGIVVATLVCQLACSGALQNGLTCADLFPETDTTVLLVAVPGDDGEGTHYYQNLQEPFVVPANQTNCASLQRGKIMGQSVLVAGTGVGLVNAALCTVDILNCGDYIKELIWSGTSGFSAQVGGAFTPKSAYNPEGTCEPNNSGERRNNREPSTTGQITRIGDLCLSTVAVQFDCKQASWQQQCTGFPDLCTFPNSTLGPDEPLATGPCLFTRKYQADSALADAIAAAYVRPSALTVPPRSSIISSYEQAYWGNTSLQTNLEYDYNPDTAPKLWNYTVCAEGSSQYFWTGATYDIVNREYVAMVLNLAYGSSLTGAEVLATTAEEAVGFLNAVYQYFDNGGKPLPYVIIRGNSNYAYGPTVRQEDGSYRALDSFNTGEFFEQQFAYTQTTFSTAVINLFLARCEGANGVGDFACQLAVPIAENGEANVGNNPDLT